MKVLQYINKSNTIGMKAEKLRNINKINPSEYYKILHNKITEIYKIDNKDTVNQINKDPH